MKIPKHLEPSKNAFSAAFKASREWSKLVKESIEKYGDRPQGGFVSGIYSEYFPKEVQENLRKLCYLVRDLGQVAFDSAPKRTRTATLVKLKNHVAETEGRGYYG